MEELEQLTAAKKSEAAQAGPVTAEDLLRIDPDLDPQFRKAVEILRRRSTMRPKQSTSQLKCMLSAIREAGSPGGAPAFRHRVLGWLRTDKQVPTQARVCAA